MESITLTADLDALARISAFVTEAAELAGLDERATWQVQLAVDEAATNVIQHAYDRDEPGDLTLTWQCEHNQFVLELRDYGRQFDPQNVPPPDISSPLEERQVGGLGLYLITRLMDEVRFDFNPQGGNVLTMIKYITPGSRDDVIVIPVIGRVDAVTAPQLTRDVHERIALGARFVLLEFNGVNFLSSSGLRALLLIRKELMTLGGELRLASLQPQVFEVFTLTGFVQVFSIHPTLEEAQHAFGQGRMHS
ncbi:anti-sigma factor antagonist [Candidatus Chloroploca sp. M-50]|uniref:Anti-sigma factor antagonist n=1 Tax=Candidatus Chloroploca mongolica TaxID=2528176 RepID=A0ABS4DCB5_9CHLR|nr:anti-sigma factor antagonist [Candidatus Chloroploca mongolica]MBP1467085.1 anti-sigma factor antagonist [Candidatus Chloroploca mongolica]